SHVMAKINTSNNKLATDKTPKGLIAEKVFVKKGDYVTESEEIAEVNREATAKKMLELNQYPTISGISAGGYDEILAAIPEKVTSNVSGKIDSVLVSDGEYINANSAICSLIGTDDLVVDTFVSEKSIGKIAVGQKVVITGSGFSGKTYNGVVEKISDIATKQVIGTVQDTVVNVKVRFLDADERIKTGYSAKVCIFTSEEKSLKMIPYEALNADDDGNEFVYVFNEGMAVKKEIETGVELADGVEILGGIAENEEILISSGELKEGDFVNIVTEKQ
ncbi:MAG: HlyD family efflux transporter periplasmic adaptor subunit, partial [Oscillospiraceae bacterium]